MSNEKISLSCDVAVIGGGTIGLTLASEFVRLGLETLVIERGNLEIEKYNSSDLLMSEEVYPAAYDGRIIGMGGTSRIWGGALIPFSNYDTSDWIKNAEELVPYIRRVEDFFNVGNMPDYVKFKHSDSRGYRLVHAKVPSAASRNTWTLTKDKLTQSSNFRLLTDTVVDKIVTEQNDDAIICTNSFNAKTFVINPKFTVISAGAIESTKLLARLEPGNSQVGKSLSDHLQIKIGEIFPRKWHFFLKTYGIYGDLHGRQMLPRFEFEGTQEKLMNDLKSSHYINIHFHRDSNGIKEIRKLFDDWQEDHKFNSLNLITAFKSIFAISRIFLYLAFFRRILFNRKFGAELVLVVEPAESLGEIITEEITRIRYEISDLEVANVFRCAQNFYNFWDQNHSSKFGRLEKRIQTIDDVRRNLKTSAYHPVGTTSMSTVHGGGAINADLSTNGNPRIFVVSTSALPRSGGGNPTLMVLALGMSVVDKICENFSSNKK
jgi:choline dehydrogenase-like flavoprotein